MKIPIVLILLFCLPSIALAEIGQSVDQFERSRFVISNNFIIDSTVDVGIYSTAPGKEKSLYKNMDERVWIELLTDKDGKNIFVQTITYQMRQKPNDADQDKNLVLAFLKEATGGKADEKVFLDLYDSAPKHIGVKQEAKSEGFLISVVIYKQATANEWSISVKRAS